MKPDEVMEEIADALRTIPGLNVFGHPVDACAPPAAMVWYPSFEFGEAFQRGLDRASGSIVFVAGRLYDRSTRDVWAPYCSGNSTQSIVRAIHNWDFTTCSFCRVTDALDPEHWEMAGVPMLATRFLLDIAGPGTT